MKNIHVTGYYIKHIYIMQLMKHIHLSIKGILIDTYRVRVKQIYIIHTKHVYESNSYNFNPIDR